MIKEYKDKKVVVTGGANGIGRELALGCAKRGADVLVVDIHGDEAEAVAAEICKLGQKGIALQADVSLTEECQKIFDYTVEVFGRCDILINNAGVSTGADVWDIKEDDIKWEYTFTSVTHLMSSSLISHTSAPVLTPALLIRISQRPKTSTV